MADSLGALRDAYNVVKECTKGDCGGNVTSSAIGRVANLSLEFLKRECLQVDLASLVPGKQYISFARKTAPDIISRPVNAALFDGDPARVLSGWEAWASSGLEPPDLARMSYTTALAPCLAMELFDRQNKKGPATYFESLIGHIFSKALGVAPRRKASLVVAGRRIRMTMDFIFDLDRGRVRVHLPIKMSTRERVVQAWAHQRLLDSAYGEGSYRGIMVLFSETKLSLKKREVVEICVPDQWLAYQGLLSKMHRIYYFDVPARYQALTRDFPDLITIKQFGEFFIEKEQGLFD